MTIAKGHTPHSYNQVSRIICNWNFYINLTQLCAMCWSHQWLFSNHNLSENRKAKNNKSINVSWVQNMIYVVNNPKIPFVHSRGQVKWKESRMTVFTLTDAMWTKVQRNCFLQPSHPSALRACLIPAKIKTVFNIKCSGKFLHFHITVTARDID